MELRQLTYFLVLAEELHFGRAAARLDISQPSLSQQIRSLERELDAVLLERTSRRVKLTPAGAALLDGAKTITAEIHRTEDAVRDVTAGRRGSLTIGSVPAGFNGILVPVIRRLRREAPELRVSLRPNENNPALLQLVRQGDLDVALLRGAAETPGLTIEPLFEEPFIAYLPRDHRLANETGDLSLLQLADEPLVLWSRGGGPHFYDNVIASCVGHGFNPRIIAEEDSLEAQLAMVAGGLGISLQAASNAVLTRTDLVIRHLVPGDMRCTLDFAYSKGRRSAAVDTFRRVAADVAATHFVA